MGIAVPYVRALSADPVAVSASAGYLDHSIEAYEKDAKVALAGYSANARDHPHLTQTFDLFADTDEDIQNTRSAVYRIVSFMGDQLQPDEGVVHADKALQEKMLAVFTRLVQETDDLVARNWAAIERVAKALERHDQIDQTELDRLIAVTKRRSGRSAATGNSRS